MKPFRALADSAPAVALSGPMKKLLAPALALSLGCATPKPPPPPAATAAKPAPKADPASETTVKFSMPGKR